MATLSVIIITHNEENNLPRVLESVKFADEIVVNDSNSTDRTVEVARSFNCKVILSEFTGFGDAKQRALEQATGNWVLSIDADEEVDSVLQQQIKEAVNSDKAAGYLLNRKSQFLGRWIEHSGWYPDWVLRLFKRDSGSFDESLVHESISVGGAVAKLSGNLLHYTDPDISHYLAKMDRYTTLSAQTLHERGRRFRCFDLLLKPCAIFLKMYLLKQGFRDGIQGLLLALFSSFHVLCKYAKLWELRHK